MSKNFSTISVSSDSINFKESDYHSATGKIRYTFTNDYMFKIIFQNPQNLEGLLCSLLHLHPDQIHSITINNPIEIGRTVSDKAFILDISITLNTSSFINIELQVNDLGDWFDRSLSYLCRSFDQLCHGEGYSETKGVIHIGILDFDIFPEHSEFYSTYKLMNVKNHQIYNDKFELRVLQLNQIPLATTADKAQGLHQWAALFKATTWEEIKMLAQNNPTFETIAQELYHSNTDERIRRECEAREEYEFQMRKRQKMFEKVSSENKLYRQQLDLYRQEISSKEQENNSLKTELDSLKAEFNRLLQQKNN